MGRGHREGPAKGAEALGLVLGATASEDRHAPRPNKQSGGDQDDAQDQLALDQLHNAYHHEDGGDNPQNGCTHGAIRSLGPSALALLSGLPAIRWIDKVRKSSQRMRPVVPDGRGRHLDQGADLVDEPESPSSASGPASVRLGHAL
jgi:hypothetical protein